MSEQIRIGKQRPRNRDHVALPCGQSAIDDVAILKSAVGDDRNVDDTANGGREIRVGGRLETPTETKHALPEPCRKDVEDRRPECSLCTEIAGRINKGVKSFIGIIARASLGIGKAEAAVDMQVIDPEPFQFPRVVGCLRQVVARRILPPGRRRPSQGNPQI